MKMDEVDLEEDVLLVVSQEATEIVDILCKERDNVLQQIYGLVEASKREILRGMPSLRDSVMGLVDYFRNSDHQRCCNFLNTMWMFCECLPLDLETKIVSVVGSTSGMTVNHTPLDDIEKSPRSHDAKRARLDQVQNYMNTVKSFLQKKFERVTKDMRKEVRLNETWLRWRSQKSVRTRDRPAKAHEGVESSQDHKESVESLLENTSRVIILSGQAGSGKTLLMHCLGQHWAQGSYPSIQLLFLLEFRQLNLVSQPLSLKELLFRFFLPPEGGYEETEEVLSYILENPEKICFIFDGYDEFGAKLTNPEKLDFIDPNQRLPMVDLLSGLCSNKILPKCTVLVTCRPRDVFDLFGNCLDHCVAELLGFNQQRVKEYTEEYFQEKGSKHKDRAVSLLMGSHHLLSMSHVPGLCHVCCICLDHLLSSAESQQNQAQLPTSLTQIYLHILSAFLKRCQGGKIPDNRMPLLQTYRAQIAKLSKLAMGGLEKSCIVFSAQELSPELMNFGANAGILSRVDLTCADGSRSLGCAFTHLTMQEFMAALHLMTSPAITESQLKRKLNLKSRWTAKSDPKTVFTDSLHLFLCGLAADACSLNLALLEGSEDACAVVRTRQDAVRKILKKFVFSGRQTGPKIVELCRCAHETQDITLASAVGARERFELRNITLNPVDIDALAFVTSAANQMVCLDFGACSIDTECLNIIPNCKNLEHLIFRSRKYEDKFAEVLSGILPKLHSLKHLEFISANLTDAGAAKLFQALELCPQITNLNLTDNSLKDESVREIMDLVPKLPNITSVMLGKNSFSRNRIFMLIQNMNSFPNLEKIHINGKQEITIQLSPNFHTPNGRTDGAEDSGFSKELTLKDYNLRLTHVKSLCGILGDCNLTLLNLSHNSLGNKGLKQLLEHLPNPWTIQEIDVSKNGVDMDGLVFLSASLHAETNLREIEASHNGKVKLLLKFNVSRNPNPLTCEESDFHLEKKFSLAQSNVQPGDMKKLCNNLSRCPNHLELDFSEGTLRDETIKILLNSLPDLKSLMLLNLSHVQMSTDGAVLLVRTLADCQRTTVVDLRPEGKAFIKFVQHKAEAASCRLTQYKLNSSNVEKLCEILEHCGPLTDLDLSSNFLGDEGVKTFTDLLPRIKISSSVSLNDNRLTIEGALNLGNLLNTCERVATVELSLGEQERSQVHFVQGDVTIHTLRLRQCQFEESHLQKLMEILSSCPRPLRVQLSSVTLPFQSRLSLLSSLARLNSIHALELSNNSFDDEAISHLVGQMNSDYSQRTIRIEEPWIKADAAVSFVAASLRQNPTIKEIRVEKTCLILTFENVTPSNAPCLFAVRSISFADCDVEGQHLSPLQLTVQNCSFLQELHFSQLAMGTSGAEFLSSVLPSLENLKRISLSSKAETGDEAVIFALQHAPKHLESLSLSHHVIGDSAAAALGNALQGWTNLRSLTLTQCSGWTAAGGNGLVHGLVQCLLLEEIRLDSVVLDEESTVCLAGGLHSMTLLKKLSLNKMTIHEGGGVQCLLAGLHGLTALEDLELVSLRMGDQGITELVKHIPKWSNLRTINLSGNVVSDRAGEMLVMALSNCTELRQLHLSRNNLAHGFAARLGQVLPCLSHLSELDLSENKLGSVGCSSLYEGLIKMKALKKLHLISVGTPDLVTVVSSLKDCTSIEDISLSWNECGNDVVLKLAEVLPLCSKLKRLDLEANSINTAGAKTLAACLPSCPWIEVIRLWRNPIVKDDEILKDQRLNFSST